MNLPHALRRSVVERAEDRCEYCRLSQAGQEAVFHIDHVTPIAAGGKTELGNLALACVSCSLRKGARLYVFDADSGATVPVFNPRRESWSLHFRWERTHVAGLTPIGRATVEALSLNRPLILAIREEEEARGRHP